MVVGILLLFASNYTNTMQLLCCILFISVNIFGPLRRYILARLRLFSVLR